MVLSNLLSDLIMIFVQLRKRHIAAWEEDQAASSVLPIN